jgi:hypothetical protein
MCSQEVEVTSDIPIQDAGGIDESAVEEIVCPILFTSLHKSMLLSSPVAGAISRARDADLQAARSLSGLTHGTTRGRDSSSEDYDGARRIA